MARRLDRGRSVADDDDPEAATRLDLPENFRMPFVHEFTGMINIKAEDFNKLQDHQEPVAIGTDHVEKKPRKKKNLETGPVQPVQRTPKFKNPPRFPVVDERNEDGTYRIGRSVFDANGELLYRLC